MTSSILKRALACALATLFAFTLFPSLSSQQNGSTANKVYAEEKGRWAPDSAAAEYPEWALLPDGTPNPAFVYQDGSMITIDPDNLHDSGYVYSYIDESGNTVVVNEGNAPDVMAPGGGMQGAQETPDMSINEHGDPDGTIEFREFGEGLAFIETDETGESGDPGVDDGYLDLNKLSLFAAKASVGTRSKPFDRFFSLNNGVALFGSGSAWRHYFVPAYSDVPLVSLCLQKGLRNPGDDSPTAGVERGADSWMINLASWAPSILRSYGLAMSADDSANKTLVAYVQSAIWVRQGALSASDGGLLDALVASTNIPAISSNPTVSGIPDNSLSRPAIVKINGIKYGQHGPFTYSGGANAANVNIYYGNPLNNIPAPGAFVGDSGGNAISKNIANGTSFYIYLPKQAAGSEAIHVRISSSYSTVVQARAFTVAAGQDQLVMPQWDAVSGERVFSFVLEDLKIENFTLRILKNKEDPDDTGGPAYATLPMEGAVFHLYAAEDIFAQDISGALLYAKDSIVGSMTTDPAGSASLDNIPRGKYILREHNVADPDKTLIGGALRSKYYFVGDINVEFTEQEQDNLELVRDLTIADIYRLGKITIEKTGARAGEPLEGAVFEISVRKDIFDPVTGDKVWSLGDVVDTIITDVDGLASLKDLLPGDYTLREIFAPMGYLPVPDKNFSISDRTGTEKFEFYTWNLIDHYPAPETPRTADPFAFSVWMLLFVVAAGAIVSILAARRRREM